MARFDTVRLIATAAFALRSLGITPCLYVSWEVDPDCRRVIQHHFPDAVLHGDVEKAVASEIAALVHAADPQGSVLVASGPPCTDFSRINDSAMGRAGPEGRKFEIFCDLVSELEPLLGSRLVLHCCENVIFQQENEIQHFSSRLKASAIAIDAADRGLVNRPRLYWTRVDWAQPRLNPVTEVPLRWGRLQKVPRLHMDLGFVSENELELPPNLWLHRSVAQHEKRVPCFTTHLPQHRTAVPHQRS